MAKERNGFLVFHDLEVVAEQLSDEQRGVLFLALFRYSKTGEQLHSDDPLTRMAFEVFRSGIDRNAAMWEETRAKRAEAGRLGGLARAENFRRPLPEPEPYPSGWSV